MRSPFLYEPDPEIERTFHLRRKKQKIEEQRRGARRTSINMAGRGDDQRRMLSDFVTYGVQGIASSISRPNVDTNNFELKPALISLVQQSQFGSAPLEVSNLHPSVFLEVCDILKLNRVSIDAIRL